MEFAQIIRLLRKWGWLIIVAAVVTGGLSYVIRSSQPLVYNAETIISIGGFIEAPNPDANAIYTGFQLTQTYAELVRTSSVLDAAADELDVGLTGDDLRGLISVRSITDTALLVIGVTYTEPTLTADIANAVANQLKANSPSNLTEEEQRQIEIANLQIARLTDQLETARLQLQSLDQREAAATTQVELDSINTQRISLVDQINQATANLAQFNSTVSSLQQKTNSVDIVEPARVPTGPTGGGSTTTALIGTLIGAAIAFGVGLLIDYLDDTLRSTEQAAQALALPVLGTVARFGKPGETYRQRLISQLPLMISPISEGYRTIRTNLMFSAANERKKVYLVTSPGPQEGKSLTTANLAISMAIAGQRVLLIDCDLRRPKVHEIFGLTNEVGLTSLLLASHQGQNGSGDPTHDRLRDCIKPTHVDKLSVITSGFIPQNPNEVLGSTLMQHWVRVLQDLPTFDMILIDTPPTLLLSDAVVLSASTGADVVMVIEAGRTRRAAALRVKQMFEHVGCQITGIILNGVSARDEAYYGYGYGYGYDGYYYRPDANSTKKERVAATPGQNSSEIAR
jgi:capsular exopolysaccharide synthesis family protein